MLMLGVRYTFGLDALEKRIQFEKELEKRRRGREDESGKSGNENEGARVVCVLFPQAFFPSAFFITHSVVSLV